MKAFLLHQDTDFDLEGALPPGHEALIQDLELTTLIATMAAGDQLVFDVVQRVLLLSLRDPDAIVYRQQILADCLREPAVVRDLYALAGEALKAEVDLAGTRHGVPANHPQHRGAEDGAVRGFSPGPARGRRDAW